MMFVRRLLSRSLKLPVSVEISQTSWTPWKMGLNLAHSESLSLATTLP